MLTGTYPMLSGMHDFSGNKLSPLQPTLASVLKQAGVPDGSGKSRRGRGAGLALWTQSGFDFYYDHFDFSRLDEANLDEMERRAMFVTDVALDWLGKNSQKKFFSLDASLRSPLSLSSARALQSRICGTAVRRRDRFRG